LQADKGSVHLVVVQGSEGPDLYDSRGGLDIHGGRDVRAIRDGASGRHVRKENSGPDEVDSSSGSWPQQVGWLMLAQNSTVCAFSTLRRALVGDGMGLCCLPHYFGPWLETPLKSLKHYILFEFQNDQLGNSAQNWSIST
jgi:hypothetical protein